ncbi:MAG: carbohydrate ABC transporter permease [Ruminococcaceae bacterium]|nr:carbohydrate ABC transporter permease [Oscillospiraceae bacterium]
MQLLKNLAKEVCGNMQKRISRGEMVFNVINYIYLALCVMVTLLPFATIIAKSFSDTVAIESGEVFLWPVDFNIQAYKNLITDGQLLRSMKNTVIITIIGTCLNMIFTTTAAYALSKKRLLGGKLIMKLMTFTMIFSGGTIPHFIVVKSLGLMNTYGALWLPGLITVYNLIVMKTFFEQLPESLEEAARIDGANDLLIFFKIVLPLSLATIATITLFYAVAWWNE